MRKLGLMVAMMGMQIGTSQAATCGQELRAAKQEYQQLKKTCSRSDRSCRQLLDDAQSVIDATKRVCERGGYDRTLDLCKPSALMRHQKFLYNAKRICQKYPNHKECPDLYLDFQRVIDGYWRACSGGY